ncbi:hypothetical protein V5799_026098 [Amblyomma americanum]|uniref:THAP-type domain-containing protein n=1 Tax=Amblyomma americanum TaxID=6943 RepID=A0AAQ4DJJ6_AMBAM
MHGHCCVPRCRGNYDGGERVRVFTFPSDQARRAQLIRAIHRADLTPGKRSVVCECHFKLSDIVNRTSYTDTKTGKVIEVALKLLKRRDWFISFDTLGNMRHNVPKGHAIGSDNRLRWLTAASLATFLALCIAITVYFLYADDAPIRVTPNVLLCGTDGRGPANLAEALDAYCTHVIYTGPLAIRRTPGSGRLYVQAQALKLTNDNSLESSLPAFLILETQVVKMAGLQARRFPNAYQPFDGSHKKDVYMRYRLWKVHPWRRHLQLDNVCFTISMAVIKARKTAAKNSVFEYSYTNLKEVRVLFIFLY